MVEAYRELIDAAIAGRFPLGNTEFQQ